METTRPLDDGPLDELDEQLVAYLDGELEDEKRVALEDRLMEDANCKHRLRQLQQSFDMLDDLPRTHVNQDFARTTVEMIAITASQELEVVKKRQPWKYGKLVAGVALASVLFFVAGISWVKRQQQAGLVAELRNLAVAENLRAYSLIKSDADIEFFAALASEARWVEAVSVQRELDELPTRDVSQRLAAVGVDERATSIASLDPDVRRNLRLQKEQFDAQPAQRQAVLLALSEKLEQRPDADDLILSMVTYIDWLDSVKQSQRTSLQALLGQKKLAAVLRLLDEDRASSDGVLVAEIEKIYAEGLRLGRRQAAQIDAVLSADGLAELNKQIANSLSDSSLSLEDAKAHFLFKYAILFPKIISISGRSAWVNLPEWVRSVKPLDPSELKPFDDAFEKVRKKLVASIGNDKDRERGAIYRLVGEVLRRSPIQRRSAEPSKEYLSSAESQRERFDLQDPELTLRELRGLRGRGQGGSGSGRPMGFGGGGGPFGPGPGMDGRDGRGGPGRGGPNGRGGADGRDRPDGRGEPDNRGGRGGRVEFSDRAGQ